MFKLAAQLVTAAVARVMFSMVSMLAAEVPTGVRTASAMLSLLRSFWFVRCANATADMSAAMDIGIDNIIINPKNPAALVVALKNSVSPSAALMAVAPIVSPRLAAVENVAHFMALCLFMGTLWNI